MKKWTTAPVFEGAGKEIKEQAGEFFGELLLRRGIATPAQAQEFLNGGGLGDPRDVLDMEKAAEIIREALDEGKQITVYGDYDCDGVTSTAILYSYLEANGAPVDFYIPDRSEGYGMNKAALERIIDGGTELIITVDNGISAIDEAEYIKSRGVSLIITDHHQPPETLPVCDACVDPHRIDDPSEFKELCGAGVVLKLLCLLEDEEFVMDNYSDLAAVGTVGDIVSLRGENRYIVRRGLENIRNGQNIGLERLIRSARRDPAAVTSTDIAFYVSPRINAVSRMTGSAAKAVRLLLADEPDTAARIAEEIELLNNDRRTAETAVLDDIALQFSEHPEILRERVIFVAGKGWNTGIIGLVAARLEKKYGKPVFIMSCENGTARGSARSGEGFPIYKALNACKDVLLTHGGHPKAGGFSLEESRVEEFRQRLLAYAKEFYRVMPDAELFADMEITCGQLTADNIRLLDRLEPFGEGNRAPLFLLRNCVVTNARALSDGKFTTFWIKSDGCPQEIKVISFDLPFAKFYPAVGSRIDLIACAQLNEYKGNVTAELRLVDFRPTGFREEQFFAAKRVYEALRRGEGCDARLAPRVIPADREALMRVYDLVRQHGGQRSAEEMCLMGCGVNYCMLRITLDAFAEAGMIKLSGDAESAEIQPTTKRHDLFAEGLLAELKKQFT